jgi:hypothetical protein
MRKHAAVYRSAFTAAYRAVAQVTGAAAIVDSTKYPVHGLMLATMSDIDLATMLLVRDPRAVAWSWTRHRVRPEVHWERREMPRHNVLRSALAWNLSNSLTAMNRRHGEFRSQRYEDFVADPTGELTKIATLALERPVTVDSSIFEEQPSVPHSIAGNPVRIGSNEIRIRADDAWRSQMGRYPKMGVTTVCLPQIIKFDYPIMV